MNRPTAYGNPFTSPLRWSVALLLVATFPLHSAGRAAPSSNTASNSPAPLRVITLGDSITRGVRPGVSSEETFAHLLGEELRKRGHTVEVVNAGIGGERTDQALARLEPAVVARSPRLVTVMYGTNDSYVDAGKRESRISLEAYRENLRRIVAALRHKGIEPLLMTEPRWAADARPNGLGENPNVRLEPYVAACRETARELGVLCVDHYARWTEAERAGVNLREWTTDGCHPNARGHRELAQSLLPVVLRSLEPTPVPIVPFEVRVETVQEHDDRKFLWYHPRAAALPGLRKGDRPRAVMTLQKHLHTSDHYSGLSVMHSRDGGKSWSKPDPRPELDWQEGGPGVSVAVADVTPGWHAPTGKLLAIGAQVRYSRAGEQLEDQPRAHQTAYAVHDPKSGTWSTWKRLEMPDDPRFNFARSACAQWVVQPDGTLLIPFYIGRNAKEPYSTAVVQCRFDGKELKYVRHGNVLSLPVARGLYEPSLVRAQGRYFLTIRNDHKGYVTRSRDGLTYEPVRPWTFDDGADLGSYNTQQHWLAHSDGLFLVYTRRGANNDHIIRHRAPLFIAQVDPERLCVLRKTERVLIPERGGEFGNFGANPFDRGESWVTVAEGVWSDDARKRGAKGALFLARVLWGQPNRDAQ